MAKKKTTRKKTARTPASKSKSRRTASATKRTKTSATKKKAKASKRPSSKPRSAAKAPKRSKGKAGARKKTAGAPRKRSGKPAAKAKAPAAAKTPRKRSAEAKPAAAPKTAPGAKVSRADKPAPASGKPRTATTGERKPGMLDPTPTHPNDEVNARNTPARLTRKQLNHFRELLLKRRAELIGDVQAMESGALRGGGSGDSGHAPMHMADAGSDTYDQEFALQLAATERELLEEIDKSLQNIQDGTYGICEVTGKPISLPRLEAKPWAKVCIEVARERDRFHRFRR